VKSQQLKPHGEQSRERKERGTEQQIKRERERERERKRAMGRNGFSVDQKWPLKK
jgi:hypothetical protein